MMKLEDAISHLEEILNDSLREWSCKECRDQHEDLYSFLKELKQRRETDSVWHDFKKDPPPENETVLVVFEYFRYGDYNRTFRDIGLYEHPYEHFINGMSGWKDLKILKWKHLGLTNYDMISEVTE